MLYVESIFSLLVRCTGCTKHLCNKCDLNIHIDNPFHHRKWFKDPFTTRNLLPEEFLNRQGNVELLVSGLIWFMSYGV